ncbi:MAG: LVIVD repeat-containing protein [Chitinophagaceae bacterium]
MKNRNWLLNTFALFITAFLLQGCIKDSIQRTYTYTLYRPVYKTTAEVRSNIKSNGEMPVSQPGKLFIKDQYIFLNEVDKGVHVIDNSNPAAPRNVAFIDIPGNVDIAVKGNTLYADLYTDLVAVDITNPLQAKLTNVVEGVFPHRFYSGYYLQDSTKLIVDWIVKDTTVTEDFTRNGNVFLEDRSFMIAFSNASSSTVRISASPSVAMGGSMARFTIVDERLYTVGHQELKVFNISNPLSPAFVTESEVGMNIETIFPFKDRLFIGSSMGMYIYSIANPNAPAKLGQFSHVRSCDPVIADDTHAYVTLRSGTACMGFTNQLEVLDITKLMQPALVKTYAMTNPHGLSKDGNLLFICDGRDGLKMYDAAKPDDLKLLQTIGTMETYDVIAYGGLAIVVAKDGLYQYDYSNVGNVKMLSKITIHQ